MDFIRFLFSRKFLKQLLIAVVITAAVIGGTLIFLSKYTGHNKHIPVPDLYGELINEVVQNPSYADFRFVVMDSVFNPDLLRGTVIYQDPRKDSPVKKNRQIYVTISSSTPDEVTMPDLKFLTMRQAESMLKSYGLKLGNIYYTPAFDADAVQEQLFNQNPIEPGTLIYKGTAIDLMVGTGDGRSRIIHYQAPVDTIGTDSSEMVR